MPHAVIEGIVLNTKGMSILDVDYLSASEFKVGDIVSTNNINNIHSVATITSIFYYGYCTLTVHSNKFERMKYKTGDVIYSAKRLEDNPVVYVHDF